MKGATKPGARPRPQPRCLADVAALVAAAAAWATTRRDVESLRVQCGRLPVNGEIVLQIDLAIQVAGELYTRTERFDVTSGPRPPSGRWMRGVLTRSVNAGKRACLKKDGEK